MTERILNGIFWLFCCTYLSAATGLSFGSSWVPKAGFLPVLAGIAGVFLSTVIMLKSITAVTEHKEHMNWRKLIFWLVGLLFYIVLWYFLGYLFATFCMMLYFLKITDTSGWNRPLVVSGGTAVGFYLIFAEFLGINLP